jgi:hypothetical protein
MNLDTCTATLLLVVKTPNPSVRGCMNNQAKREVCSIGDMHPTLSWKFMHERPF